MLLRFNKYIYLVIAICVIVTAAVVENRLLKRNPEVKLVQEFQADLIENETTLNIQLDKLIASLPDDDLMDLEESISNIEPVLEQTGFGFLIYYNGELIYWSSRSVAFFNYAESFKDRTGFVRLRNGFYLANSKTKNKFEVVGLHLIKSKYEYENKYLRNTFYEAYNLPDDFFIVDHTYVEDENFIIRNEKGDKLFAFMSNGEYHCTTNQLYFPGIFYFIGLIILLFYFRLEFVGIQAPYFLKLFGMATVLFIVYWLHIIFKAPKVFLHLPFFSPDFYAISDWLPSLGDFFILTIFVFFWLYNFGISVSIKYLHEEFTVSRRMIALLLLLFAGSLFLLTNYFVEQLIFNSTISFSLNRIVDISGQSVLAIFSVGFLLFGILFFLIRINEEASEDFDLGLLSLIAFGIVLFLGTAQYLATGKVAVAVLLMFVVSCVLSSLFSRKYLHKYTLSYLIIFVSVASIYSLYVFNRTVSEKEREIQKLFAVTLVTERDLAAEEFLFDIQQDLQDDPSVIGLLSQHEDLPNYVADVQDYIERAYFNSYFRKYSLNINVCFDNDSLIVDDYGMMPCNSFMQELIQTEGDRVAETDFYFMDNMNGRISYTGSFQYALPPDSSVVHVYVDLDSDLLFEGIGFPELLIDESKTRAERYKKFDYAKYYGGSLTDKFGEYNYNFHVDVYLENEGGTVDENNEFVYKKWHGREHLIYHTREHNYVIVSRHIYTFIDYLISFPYLFVFYFLSILIILIVGNQNVRNRRFAIDLKFKIQAAIISIVFVSLLGVALATILYNVEEYQTKHKKDLDEKMKSIAEEIDMRLEDKREITDSLEIWLHRELAKLSNIFRTDINIYGADGNLIASSRGEIFENGLISTRMNARAYNEIYQNFQAEYSEKEDIGQLSYLSAYKPIINNYSDYLGFINLPYFIKQDNYSQEITTFVVAFINLYVLLFLLSIIAAVFIANQITRPLVVIQENLKKMELGKHNDPIHYNRNDEIGSLVKEYNKKVDELAISADLLARSERESAWREMAKQIAHEIKNPLTPMKLNIQYLQRAKGKDEEYNAYLERVTGTLIEQIDNLSNIATEFSNFAKIPTARNQVFCLAEQLQKVIDLYETHNRAQIEFKSNGFDKIEVNADREQLSRAVINLIRNGIQSIPENNIGKISIWLAGRDEKAIIAVKDNGAGIPVELRDKLFSPSFTTKTSGMGLGLAIVKNIVENFSGKIWFETELGIGTTFYLEIPVYHEQEAE